MCSLACHLTLRNAQVNGSSHTNLVPYWAKQLGKVNLSALMCSRRSGVLLLEDRPSDSCVMIGGDVFVAREGTINVPSQFMKSADT